MKVEKLQDVCLISKGKTITKATSVEGNVPVIGGGLGPTYYHNIANVKAPVITISASGANAGFVNFWDEPIWASDCSTIIEKPGSPAIIGYIYKFLQGSQEFINSKLRKGSAQPHVYSSDIGQLRIPLPSIIEQKQIVEKLDKTFVEIASLEKNLQLKEEKTNQLLQSMLSDTFNNTEDIYMKVTKLGEICEMYQPKTISTKEMVPGGKYTVFGANGAIGKYDKYNHESPQLLVTCRGATCGSVNISEPFSWINGNAMVIKPKENLVTFGYLKYAFLGGINVSGAITGSAQPQITRTTLEQILIPTPSIDYQCLAVEKLDKVFAEIDKVKIQISTEKKQIASLQQSILSNAFKFDEKAA